MKNDKKRFLKYVNKTRSCWLWNGAVLHASGIFFLNGRPHPARRAAWIIFRGSVPTEHVLSKCGKNLCVRPSHLIRGTGKTRESRKSFFWKNVRKTRKCWEWIGTRDKNGYGRIHISGEKKNLTHRFSWELKNGPIPKGKFLCHRCDNPPCVKPSHLFIGSYAENINDCVSKNRHSFGERNGHAKLKNTDIHDIFEFHKKGLSNEAISMKYPVCSTIISRILNRKIWRNIHFAG